MHKDYFQTPSGGVVAGTSGFTSILTYKTDCSYKYLSAQIGTAGHSAAIRIQVQPNPSAGFTAFLSGSTDWTTGTNDMGFASCDLSKLAAGSAGLIKCINIDGAHAVRIQAQATGGSAVVKIYGNVTSR
jgi:hypothetical protein